MVILFFGIECDIYNFSIENVLVVVVVFVVVVGDGMSSVNVKFVEIVSMKRFFDGSFGGFFFINGL